nr:putative reverse transcriptase domain, aspartic peptidase domain protein [Tanacetum cinerariifolium]
LPSGSGGFQIYSDASKKGLGCVLMQHGKVFGLCFDATWEGDRLRFKRTEAL